MKRQQFASTSDAPHTAFVGGPFDFAHVRSRIVKALVAEGFRVVQLADETPRTTSPAQTSILKLSEVQISVLYLGPHPGSFLPDDNQQTYSGLEIEGSIHLDLPVIALLVHDAAYVKYGKTVKCGASAELLQRQRRIIQEFFAPAYFRLGTDVELQVIRAVREWVPDKISEREATRRLQVAHMASEPLPSNSDWRHAFSCTVEIREHPTPIAREDAEALGLSPSYLECFSSVSGLGCDWVYLSEAVWSRVAARALKFPMLVRGETRYVGRHSRPGCFTEVGGFAMDKFIASC